MSQKNTSELTKKVPQAPEKAHQAPQGFHMLDLPFGPYEGKQVCRAPRHWLTWLAMQARWEIRRDGIHWPTVAKAELKRRGTKHEGIIPSHHAIDKFSMKYLGLWKDRSIGIAHFLGKMADEAWLHGTVTERQQQEEEGEIMIRIKYKGIIFCFGCEPKTEEAVVLKTVI